MPPARRSPRSTPSTRSSASRSSARTWRRWCSRKGTTSSTSRCRGWCTGRITRPCTIPRTLAPVVFSQGDYVVDIKVPGMVHGRVIRPEIAGAVPVKVDESSIKDIPGAQVVHQNGFLGVVAPKEWDAIRAMKQLKVEWSKVEPPFPNQTALYDHIRKAPVRKRAVEGKTAGNVDEAFKNAARVIEAEYEWPFQSHAPMGPACAVVEIKDGLVTCWTGSQKPHFVRDGIADTLGVPAEKIHVKWVTGPGS